MPWSGCWSVCIQRSFMAGRLREWIRWWIAGCNARTYRWIWEIPHGSSGVKRYRQHCCYILLNFTQFPNHFPGIITCFKIRFLPRRHSHVSLIKLLSSWSYFSDTDSVIPLAIAGAHRFFDVLSNFLGIISYWPGPYTVILVFEHFIFRHGSTSNYDISIWNRPSKLPYGLAAFLSLAVGFSVAVPAMDQVWYVGPIAKTTGDLGFELSFVVALIIYPPLRWLEIRMSGRI